MSGQGTEKDAPLPKRFSPEHLAMERSWRDGLDLLDALLDDCAQSGDETGAIYVWAVRAVVQSVRAYEDATDESIRSALWEEAVIEGQPWATDVTPPGSDDA